MAWPRFSSERAEPQGDNQMAAPADTRTPNMHRAKRIAPRECGWKHGDSGHSAGEKNDVQRKNERTDLTPTGLLMEGHYTWSPAGGFECNGDVMPSPVRLCISLHLDSRRHSWNV